MILCVLFFIFSVSVSRAVIDVQQLDYTHILFFFHLLLLFNVLVLALVPERPDNKSVLRSFSLLSRSIDFVICGIVYGHTVSFDMHKHSHYTDYDGFSFFFILLSMPKKTLVAKVARAHTCGSSSFTCDPNDRGSQAAAALRKETFASHRSSLFLVFEFTFFDFCAQCI